MNFDLDVLKIDPAKELEKLSRFIVQQTKAVFRRKGVIVGLSGGIDSACTAAISTHALGKEYVVGLVLPEKESNPISREFAVKHAQQLGINVERVKLILLGAATMITAAAVCFCGIIGFVGIIIPHAVRLIWGPDHRFLLPLATFAGAIFLILADTAARTMLAPTEIPVGAITAFLGAPFFLYLLRKRKRAVF